MPINCREYKALIIYSYGKILVNNEKEWTADNCNDISKLEKTGSKCGPTVLSND